jgi:serine/threonine protein kinase
MAPEVIREQYYDETIDMWSLGITIIEMMDRVPPHYRIKDEYELFETVLTEPSPTFTYSYPSMYMRGLVAWLLDEDPRTRPSARDVILVRIHEHCVLNFLNRKLTFLSFQEIDAHIQSNLLRTSTPDHFTDFLYQVLP